MSSSFFRSLVPAAALFIAATAPASATMMIERMSLDRITREAGRIVHGTVTEVRSGRDESGLPATWVTLDVARTLKGHATRQLTFKQAGVAEPLSDGTLTRIAGMPRYTVGEEVVLFLRGESAHGFTSPVGLGQGTFRVNRQAVHPEVRSELGGSHGGKVDLEAFLSAVTTLASPAE